MFEVNRLFLLQKPLQTHALELVLSYYVYLYLRLRITVFESISNKVKCVELNNNFDVIFVMHLFIMSNVLNNHENIEKDAILLFEVGQALIQTFNRRNPLFEIVNPKIILIQSINMNEILIQSFFNNLN